MARIILVTGGSRSGKSSYAQKLGESLPGERAYIATCPVIDEELRQRIARHKQERAGRGWATVEETSKLAAVMQNSNDYEVLLVDCLTLWINNLMYEAGQGGQSINEDNIAEQSRELLEACTQRSGTVIFVTNEVGMGIVPENAAARKYRDLVGRCNQVMAEAADTVTLLSCGIPLNLKG